MKPPSRRQFLSFAVGGLAVSVSGCTEAVSNYLGPEEPGEFLVVSANLSHSPGYRVESASYPEDIVALVAIENRRPNRQQGTLELELRYVPDDGEQKEWQITDELDVPGGISPSYTYVFESAYQSDSEVPDDYEISGRIIQSEDSERSAPSDDSE